MFQEQQQAVTQDVLQPRSPRIAVKFLECREHSRRDERAIGRPLALKHVACNRMRGVGRVEEDNVIRAVTRDRL